MSKFNIRFIPNEDVDTRADCCYGELCIESLRERFVVDITFWERADYEKQWLRAALNIVDGDKSALIVSVTNPATSNFVRWWAMYRDQDTIYFQEQIRFLAELSDAFDPYAVEKFVLPRETVSEDGEAISEWSTTVSTVRDFLSRASSSRD